MDREKLDESDDGKRKQKVVYETDLTFCKHIKLPLYLSNFQRHRIFLPAGFGFVCNNNKIKTCVC